MNITLIDEDMLKFKDYSACKNILLQKNTLIDTVLTLKVSAISHSSSIKLTIFS